MNAIVFRNRVFADAVKLKWGHAGLGWALNPKTGIIVRRGRFTDTGTPRRQSCKDKEKLEWYRYMPSNAKAFKQPPELRRL